MRTTASTDVPTLRVSHARAYNGEEETAINTSCVSRRCKTSTKAALQGANTSLRLRRHTGAKLVIARADQLTFTTWEAK